MDNTIIFTIGNTKLGSIPILDFECDPEHEDFWLAVFSDLGDNIHDILYTKEGNALMERLDQFGIYIVIYNYSILYDDFSFSKEPVSVKYVGPFVGGNNESQT